ncbi:helix-turn-helix domain-containing protein [Caulobacter sp. RHG1]|uniref:helix-turn-helix domain-containing protein n=1 Tax=Caulobacter sp. (strain RHG1) TaxID=2545762 RepID=UPI00155202E7|nr:AraC family transcriptional regulator [Caulobacter sp. RHG1]
MANLSSPPLKGGDSPRAPGPFASPGLSPWQERKVLRHIDEHLPDTLTIQALAALAGLSASHFARRFRASFGVAPRHYLVQRRLEHAKALMRQTRAPLCQIALASGFSDQAHMSRTFRTTMGLPPSQWRRQQAPDPYFGEGAASRGPDGACCGKRGRPPIMPSGRALASMR